MTAGNKRKLVGSFLVLCFIAILSLLLFAQATFNWRFVGSSSVTGNTIWYNVNAAPSSNAGLFWTTTGSLASCTVQIDFSNDGSTVAGQAVGAQVCTTSGSSINGAASAYHYVRVSYVLGSGGGSISFRAQGCLNGTCTSGGGTGTPGGSNTNVQYNNAGNFGGNAGMTYDASHTLSLGSVGGGSGTISLNGNTSGSTTITGPAVAGTTTNPVVFSNVIKVPAGSQTNAAVQIGGAAGTGLYNSSTAIGLAYANTLVAFYDATGWAINNTLQGSISQHTLLSATSPTIAGAGCGGSSASIPIANGTGSFTINVGTAPTSGGCTVTLPTATTGWNCFVTDVTTNSTSVFLQKQTTSTTTSAVLVNFSDVAVATAPTASDIWRVSCMAN